MRYRTHIARRFSRALFLPAFCFLVLLAARPAAASTPPEPLDAWAYRLIVYLAPPDRIAAAPQLPGWTEDATAKRARYAAIARDVAAMAVERAPRHPERAVALLLALASLESGFAPDVDVGPCYQGGAYHGRCDGGASVSLWQIRIGDGTTPEGWTREDLRNRRKAARVALRMAWWSMRRCAGRGQDSGLRAYASGDCNHGQAASAARLELARRLLERWPWEGARHGNDADVKASVNKLDKRSASK